MAVSVGSENINTKLTLAPGASVTKLFTYGRPAGPTHEVLPVALARVALALRLSIASDKGPGCGVAPMFVNVTTCANRSVRPSRLKAPRVTLTCDVASSAQVPTTTL